MGLGVAVMGISLGLVMYGRADEVHALKEAVMGISLGRKVDTDLKVFSIWHRRKIVYLHPRRIVIRLLCRRVAGRQPSGQGQGQDYDVACHVISPCVVVVGFYTDKYRPPQRVFQGIPRNLRFSTENAVFPSYWEGVLGSTRVNLGAVATEYQPTR
ncbi:hypothetical protein OAE63_01265 [bacterium]|nr:hypothetical protein [bacterium]